MKRLLTALLLVGSISTPSLWAQGAPAHQTGKAQQHSESKTKEAEDLVALERFLTLSDAQLDQLLQAISKVRAMSPAQRAAMKNQLMEYRSLSPTQREQVRNGWGWQSEKDRSDWPLMMHSKTEAERTAIQTEIQALAPDKRAPRKHALLEEWRLSTKE